MQLYHSLFLFPAAGCHFKGPLALRHSFSTALPIYSLSNLYYYTLIYKCLSTALLQSFAKHLSDLIPADLIGREMNFKALSVPCINSCILWFIGVIYHTILSVFHIGMNFHIIIRREPAVKFILCCRRPEHGSVQNTTVFKAVRQPADINATTLSEGFYRHLDFLVFLDQDLRIRQCKDILFALAEIYGSVCIFQNKMISVFFPVVFVCIEIKSSF